MGVIGNSWDLGHKRGGRTQEASRAGRDVAIKSSQPMCFEEAKPQSPWTWSVLCLLIG